MTTGKEPPFKIINGVKWAYLYRGNGRNILALAKEYELYALITNGVAKNYRHHYLQSQILGLSANSNSPSNLISKFTVLKRKLTLIGMDVHYEMRGGDILITQLQFKAEKQSNEAAGLRRIEYSRNQWEADDKPLDRIKSEEPDKPVHVAINGMADSVEHAARYMPNFINHGYPRQALKKVAQESYTLFYNPQRGFLNADWRCIQDSTGIRGGTQTARALASAMRLAARDRLEINWTIHERGAAIFKQALRQLAQQGLAGLTSQQVFYANPLVNMELVDRLRRKVGMKLSEKGHVMNDLSLHQGAVAGNWISEPAMLWQNGKKGHALVKPVLTGTAIAGLFANPGTAGAAAYGITALAFAGANLVPGKSNRGIITGPGDALNHYFFGRKAG